MCLLLYLLLLDSRFKAKHSLDSDEEDEAKESALMDEEEIEGQEDSTVVGAPQGGRDANGVQPWGKGTAQTDYFGPLSLPLLFM